jgi:TonB family protein
MKYVKVPLVLSFMLFSLHAIGNCSTPALHTSNRQPLLRLAVIGFVGAKTIAQSIEAALTDALGRDPRASVIEVSRVIPALAGIGYDGSINMNKDEARRLGAAIGCDFFITGKTEAVTRSRKENESHEEAYAGIMLVDARTGSLASFDLVSASGRTSEAALTGLIKTLSARAPGYVDRIAQLSEARAAQNGRQGDARSALEESIEDVPDEGSPRAVGFAPPEFLNRVKPEYTAEAEQADITATVEAMVIFRMNGEVSRVDITRWAGFRLDESAERAIRQLKFKPATRDGKPISVRALIRYNFRRVTEPKAEEPATKPTEKPTRNLHELLPKPSNRRPA